MSKLSALCGKVKGKIVFSDGTELELKPPKVEDLSILAEAFSGHKEGDNLNSEQLSKILTIARRMLKEADSTATDEEIDEVLVSEFEKVLEGIMGLLEKSFGNKTPKN